MQDNIEPAVDKLTAARELREIFVALMIEGFTENQALVIIGQCLRGANANQ